MRQVMAVRVGVVALVWLGLVPAAAFAQSSVVGAVRDTSGAVLPGVVVDVSSPALIEKERTVVTDDQGLYRVVDLRPGVYAVTMTLPGFAAVKQEGLELPAGFTATVNAEMRLSNVEETITVSAKAPTVDTQSVTQAAVFSKDLLENLPSASKTPQSFVAFVPGVVGGLNVYALQQKTLSIHGGRPQEADTRIDGFSETGIGTPGGTGSTFYTGPMTAQETTVVVSGHAAEFQMSGVLNNVIPKDGSNRFAGSAYATYNDEHTAWSNFSDDLKARGVTAVSKTQRYAEVSAGFGGPLVVDKVWFYSSVRDNNTYRYLANLYQPLDPLEWVYVPNLAKPAIVRNEDQNYTTRVTWQANRKNKISGSFELQPHINHQNGTAAANPANTVSIEAAPYTPHNPNYLAQLTWKSPITSRVLFEAGMSFRHNEAHGQRQVVPIPVAADTIPAIDRGGLIPGLQFRSSSAGYTYSPNNAYSYRGSVSYITGAHNTKLGLTLKQGSQTSRREINSDVVYTLNNGVPSQLTLWATPILTANELNADLGVYAQDQWRLGRATINLGARYDYLNATAIGVDQPGGRWVGARSFPNDVVDVPKWHDVSTRLGAAYDLFGDGKTALKVSWNRYVAGAGTEIASANSPVTTAVTSANRSWNDVNKDYVPNCDFNNTAANGECGSLSNLNFGKTNPSATQYDGDIIHGYGKRGYNWETTVSVQRELRQGMSVSVGYYRRSYGNFTLTDNLAVTPADFDPYCITAPVDPRLPAGVSGAPICGLYDVKPAKFGASTNLTTFVDHYGEQTEVFNGVDVSGNARLSKGVQAAGGVSFGRTATNRCFVVDSPQEQRFCDVTTPFQPNIKAIAVVPLPWWDLQASTSLQSVPGPMITASYTARNAEISQTLGRNLSSGVNGTAIVELIQPGTLYSPRVNQIDVSLAKTFRAGEKRIKGTLNLFNLLNASDIQQVNLTYAPSSAWPQPTVTLDGRSAQFSVQIDF